MAHVREAENHLPICKDCNIEFKNFDNLRHHKRKYHFEKAANEEFVCDSCGKSCKTRELLNDHWNFVHKIESDLNCNLCGRSCQNMLKLKKHTLMCLSRDPDVVDKERRLYEATVTKNLELYPPMMSNTAFKHNISSNDAEEKFSETKESDSKQSLEVKQEINVPVTEELLSFNSHEQKLESKNEEKVLFNEDAIKIETEPDIDPVFENTKKRKRKKNNDPVVAKVCPICAKEVKYLNGHIKDVHTETPHEKHVCNHCGKVFAKIKKLRGHIDAVHKVQPTMCDICSQEFKNLHALRGHKAKVHEIINEVICPSCSKVFETRLKLYYHERAVHTLEDSRCQACGKTYKNRNLLQKHIKVYHKDFHEAQKMYPGNSSLPPKGEPEKPQLTPIQHQSFDAQREYVNNFNSIMNARHLYQ